MRLCVRERGKEKVDEIGGDERMLRERKKERQERGEKNRETKTEKDRGHEEEEKAEG